MEDAIVQFSGETVYARAAWRARGKVKYPAFVCPEPVCGSVVFLRRRKGKPEFFHRAHFGKRCPRGSLGKWDETDPQEEQSPDAIKQILYKAFLDMPRYTRTQILERINAIPPDTMNGFIARALVGQELLGDFLEHTPLEGNALALLYHPYYTLLLRLSIATALFEDSACEDAPPREFATHVNRAYLNSSILVNLRKHGPSAASVRKSSGLRAIEMEGDTVIDYNGSSGRPVLLSDGGAVDFLTLHSRTVRIVIRSVTSVSLRVTTCAGASPPLESTRVALIAQGSPAYIDIPRPGAVVVFPATEKLHMEREALLYAYTRRNDGEPPMPLEEVVDHYAYTLQDQVAPPTTPQVMVAYRPPASILSRVIQAVWRWIQRWFPTK